jgi:hypothetical protein
MIAMGWGDIMRRTLVVVLILIALLLGPAAPARAGAEWCDTDPLILVVTPAGNVVPVFILVGVQELRHLPAAQAASILATDAITESTAGGRATRVAVVVAVPDDHFGRGFPVRAAVSTGPMGTGTVHAAAEGISGAPMTLRFTLAVP